MLVKSVNPVTCTILAVIALVNTFAIAQDQKSVSWFSNGYIDSSKCISFGGHTSAQVVADNEQKSLKCLKISLDDTAYSGVEVCMGKTKYADLRGQLKSGALSFRIKGNAGGEKLFISLMDYGSDGYNKCESKCRLEYYGEISNKWKEFTIPLRELSREGERWYMNDNFGEYCRIDWSKIHVVKFSAEPQLNASKISSDGLASVFVDDVKIIPDSKNLPSPSWRAWRMLGEKIVGPARKTDTSAFSVWFTNKLSPGITAYGYDELTDFSIIENSDSTKFPVFATYMNDKTWSGVTLVRSKRDAIDITPYMSAGALEFKVRGGNGGEVFMIGLMDDDSEMPNRSIHSRVDSYRYVNVTKDWQTVSVPFDEFEPSGMWWDPYHHKENSGKIDFRRISNIRFSVNKNENRNISQNGEKPVKLYFSDIKLVKKTKYMTNRKYWSTFKSDSAEQLVSDFEKPQKDSLWEMFKDVDSDIKMHEIKNTLDMSRAIAFDYRIAQYGFPGLRIYRDNSVINNWSMCNSVKLDIYSDDKAQTFTFMIVDKNKEMWSAEFEVLKGWQTVTVHFRDFLRNKWWQDKDGVQDFKMDIDKVREILVRPGSAGVKKTFAIDNLRICNSSAEESVAKCDAANIRINQEGYYSKRTKDFVVANSNEKNFVVIDKDGKLAFEGSLSAPVQWELSGETVQKGDFSSVSLPGSYTIVLQESGQKRNVEIKESLYDKAFDAAVKSYYFQRSSIPLLPEFASKWARCSGHPDSSCERIECGNKGDRVNVSGGWYDAGDYGKYTITAAYSVGIMLGLAEICPNSINNKLDIPESGNSTPDYLDEMRYELDWLMRMQDTDGGVFFKVGPVKWDAFIAPCESDSKRFVIGKSTTSTLDFCAVMAMASRVYKKTDGKFSRECLKCALLAWEWALKNPKTGEPAESNGTGDYGDSRYEDEFFWAASELYIVHKKGDYKDYIQTAINKKAIRSGAEWSEVANIGWHSLATQLSPDKDPFGASARSLIIDAAGKITEVMKTNPYQIPDPKFAWASNSFQLNSAVELCYAYYFTKQNKYLESAIRVTDYIFGKNATDYCFVTGFGTRSPQSPHQRALVSDNTDLPIPGFLVGGPNGEIQDEKSNEPGVFYPCKEPARAYIDKTPAYASNEVAINWNAVLVFVLGFIVANEK